VWCEFSTRFDTFSAIPFAFCPLTSGGLTDETIPKVVDEGKHGFKNLVIRSDVVMLLTHIVTQIANRSRNVFISTALPDERHKIADHNEFCWRESAAFDRLGKFGV
jgi:hypothetical protein